MTKTTLILLFVLTLLGGFLRFYKLAENPVSLNTDEVSFAYAAYSVLKTGRDEWGEFLPVTFRSVGDYKNPVPVYALIPSIMLFGLNELGARAPFALFGTIAIPAIFFLALNLVKSKRIAFLTTLLLVISPWHIFYSRYGNDPPMAMVIAALGLLFVLKMIENRKIIFAFFGSFFLVLSMYTYYAERIFIPLIFLLLFILFLKQFKKFPTTGAVFYISSIFFVSILVFRSIFGADLARGNMVFIAGDIDFLRYIVLDHINPGLTLGNFRIEETVAMSFLIIKRYLNYLQPNYLFFTGLNMTHTGSLGLGILYLFELPWVILGVLELIRGKYKYKYLIFGWLALSLIPASLTNNEHNPGRTIVALPMVVLISGLGLNKFIGMLQKIKSFRLKGVSIVLYSLFIFINLLHAFLVYAVHFPFDRSEYSMMGNKEAVEYISDHKEEYKEVVFDPFRGVEAPTTYSLPQYYILFYTKYDPAKYQKEIKENEVTGKSGFGNYSIRKIYWPNDRYAKDTLFVGSPWSLPEKDFREGELLKKIYLSNGQLALLIVNPKPNKEGLKIQK